MFRKSSFSLFLAVSILVIPTIACAIDMEYVTYGGFAPIVNSFNQMALIFANNSYKALFFTLMVGGLFFSGMAYYVKMFMGANMGAPYAWMVPAVVGIIIYLAMVVPKGKLIIYDELYNRHETVAGIPDGIVMVVGVLNKVETGLVDMVMGSSVLGESDYRKHAGGKGFLGLQAVTSMPLTAVSTSIDQSMRRFIEDCVTPALTDPGSGLTIDSLRQKSVKKVEIAKAVNPALYTVYFSDSDPVGTATSCTNAWSTLNIDLTAIATTSKGQKTVCAAMGFDTTSGTEMAACKSRLTDILTSSKVGKMAAITVEDFLTQAYIAQRLEEVYRSGDAGAASNYGFMMNASGVMKQANEWIPTMKSAMTAIAVGLIPFLALFIPTPLFGRGIGLMLGFFVWLACWGVTDAIIHGYAIDYAAEMYEQINQVRLGQFDSEIGMDGLLFYPTQNAKILAMFGTLRMSGMMLATVISGALVKFGGSAMAHMAGGLSGQVQTSAVKGEASTLDPSGRMSEVSKLRTDTMPSQAWTNRYSAAEAATSAGITKHAATQSGLDLSQNFGWDGAVKKTSDTLSYRQVNGGAAYEALEGHAGGVPGGAATLKYGAETSLRTTDKQQQTFGSAENTAVAAQVNNFEPSKASAGQTITAAAQNNMTTQQQANIIAAASIPKTVQNAISSGGGTGWTAHEAQSLSNTFKSMGATAPLSNEQYGSIAKQHNISGGAQGAKMLHSSWLGNKAGTSQEGEKAFINRMSSEGFASKPETQKDIAAAAAQTAKTVGGAEGDSNRGGAEQIKAAGPDAAYTHGKVSKAAELATTQQASKQDASEFARQFPGVSEADRSYYNADGSLTEYATHKMALSKGGANLGEYAHGDGTSKGIRDSDGNLVRGSASGTIAASNPKGFDALVGALRNQGRGQLANYLESSGLRGKALDYRLNYDKDGKLSSLDVGQDSKGHYTQRYLSLIHI